MCIRDSQIPVQANVSTATIVTPEQLGGSIKSVEGDEVPAAEEVAEEVATEEVATEEVSAEESAEKTLLSDEVVQTIIEKAVSMVTESVKAEVVLAKAAIEAAESKAAELETELAQAKSAAVAGGPKRSAIAAGKTQANDLLVKAAQYSAKAAAATDQILAKGYKDLANEFIAKAQASTTEKE